MLSHLFARAGKCSLTVPQTMVIDANLLVVILTGDERRDRVVEQFVTWLDQRVELHAPVLAQYEVVNALTRLVATGTMRSETAGHACSDLFLLPIQYQPLRNGPLYRNARELGFPVRLLL